MVAIGALCYSTLILFTRNLAGLDAVAIAFYRAIFAFVFFGLSVFWFNAPLKIRAYRKAIPRLILLGILMSLTASLYIFSIQHTSAANAALLVNSAPIYLAFLGPWVLKEHPPRFTWISLALVLPGILLITQGGSSNSVGDISIWGISAGIISGLSYALMLLISRSLKGEAGGHVQAFWGAGVTALVLSPWALHSSQQPDLSQLWLLIPMGVISMGFSTLLYYLALQHLKVQVVSVVAILEPVFGALIGVFIFSEVFTSAGLAGCLMVLVSILLISID